jgi:hypothetical protein
MDPAKLAKSLRLRAFDPDGESGFVVDRVRTTQAEARFVERLEYDVTDIDPFGQEFTTHQIQYRQQGFLAYTEDNLLELVDEPRSSSLLLSSLSEACGFRLSVEHKEVEVLSWLRHLEIASAEPWRVESVQLSGIKLSTSISAKAVIVGTEDVLESIRTLTGRRRHTVERIKARPASGGRGTVILSRGAMANVQGFSIDAVDLPSLLRHTLVKAANEAISV